MPEPRRKGAGVASLVASGLGLGWIPAAPGTAGSLPGLLCAWLLAAGGAGWVGWTLALAAASAVAVWSGDREAARLGRSDPSSVVVDEWVGQMAALALVPAAPGLYVAGFVLFRGFDILKPFPVRAAESLPGGLGILADDLVAAAYVNLILHGWIALRAAAG